MLIREQLQVTYNFPFTDAAVRALNGATEEAVDFYKDYIGTEHLLLGYLRYTDPDFLRDKLGVNISTGKIGCAILDE